MSYGYDAADRLTQITQGSATVGVSYDGAGRRTALSLPNGLVTAYTYDAGSRLTGLTYTHGATVLGTLTYGYDAAGNRTQVGGTWARTALPEAVASATYDAANQQVTFGGQTLTYDATGNLTSDGVNTYSWNARNQLVGITGASVTASFSYDGLGRRQGKTINGASTQFLYDGLNPVQELSDAGVTANLLTSLGIDEYFTRTTTAGTRTLLTDALGSTITLTDDAGALQSEYTYEPFGATTETGADSNPFQYTGRENDGTGLYYYRARYYHPGLQRFISEDPIGLRGGDPTLYAYAANSPLRFVDPRGLSSLEYDRATGTITVFVQGPGGEQIPIAQYPAQNLTIKPWADPYTLGSNGPAPSGSFPVQAPISVGNTTYGSYFIPVGGRGPNGERLDIARQRGIGIHAGGKFGPLQSPTEGCIRVNEGTLRALVDLYKIDPITSIRLYGCDVSGCP